jgi:L-ascorbate metabolism protein UlaG (beta-lactamase superfamily)
MRITKFGHACIRIEHDGHTIVVDPGGFTQPEAVDGADTGRHSTSTSSPGPVSASPGW